MCHPSKGALYQKMKKTVLRLETLLMVVFFSFIQLYGQEGTWSLTASAGIGMLSMAPVNQTLDKTVESWNQNQNQPVPIGPFQHFSSSPFLSSRLTYRYERDVALSISFSYFSRTLTNSYSSSNDFLSLERTVGSTDLLLGLTYYLPQLVYRLDSYVIGEVGPIFARADAITYATTIKKTGSVGEMVVTYDTKAFYRKSKLVANLGAGGAFHVAEQIFLRAEALYRIAQVGQMDGDITSLRPVPDEQRISTTEFDFSALVVQVGIGVEF